MATTPAIPRLSQSPEFLANYSNNMQAFVDDATSKFPLAAPFALNELPRPAFPQVGNVGARDRALRREDAFQDDEFKLYQHLYSSVDPGLKAAIVGHVDYEGPNGIGPARDAFRLFQLIVHLILFPPGSRSNGPWDALRAAWAAWSLAPNETAEMFVARTKTFRKLLDKTGRLNNPQYDLAQASDPFVEKDAVRKFVAAANRRAPGLEHWCNTPGSVLTLANAYSEAVNWGGHYEFKQAAQKSDLKRTSEAANLGGRSKQRDQHIVALTKQVDTLRNSINAKTGIHGQGVSSEKRVCRDFMAGRCRQSNCRFSHQTTESDRKERVRYLEAEIKAVESATSPPPLFWFNLHPNVLRLL
jgi:hypothetical protein